MAKVSFQLEELDESPEDQIVEEELNSETSDTEKPKIGFFKGLTMSKKEKEAFLAKASSENDSPEGLHFNDKQDAPLSKKEQASNDKEAKKLARKQKKEQSKADKANSRKKSIEQRAMIKAHRSLLNQDFADMSGEDIAHYYEAKMRKEALNLRIKRIATLVIIILFVVGTLFFGVYNAYLKPDKSVAQITSEVNLYNRTSAFPENGVEGFLEDNLQSLFEKNVTSIEEGGNTVIKSPRVNFIAKRSNEIANVYFSAEIANQKGTARHNFVIPISYDFESNGYSPAGELSFSPNSITDSTVEADNAALSFKGIAPVKDKNVKADAEVFINNFFVMLYNENLDTRNSYTGLELAQDDNVKFVKITRFDYYNGFNKNGYNARVEYMLKLDNGVTYTTSSYLDIATAGSNSFIINAIL